MDLQLQKRLAADVLDCSEKRVKFDPKRLHDIDEAITKTDIRVLVGEGAIRKEQKQGVSRARAKHHQNQKRKGRRKGQGNRKGTPNARENKKDRWKNKVRAQRKFIKELKENDVIDNDVYRKLYNMIKGGFFRSKRHIKLVLNERGWANEA
jgi:large subunit ribosomal protein L19e